MARFLYIIRHAQSQPAKALENAQWPLSELGRTQALARARFLMPLGITTLFSSPYLRAIGTVEPFSRAAELEIHVREALHERAFVNLEDDDFMAVWKRSWEDFDCALPGCETNREAQMRIVQAIREIVSASKDDVLGVCSHGAVIGLLLHSLDPCVGRERVERLRNPDVMKIILQQDEWAWDHNYELPGLGDVAARHA